MNTTSHRITKLSALRRDTLRKIDQVGLVQTLTHGLKKMVRDLLQSSVTQCDPFDKKYGTDTERIISVGALDIPDVKLKHSNRYEAVVPEAFADIIASLPPTDDQFVFVDIGSGKGRAILLASLFPFKEVVGVEVSQALTKIAEENVRKFQTIEPGSRKISLVCEDGGAFRIPETKCVLYLNNPFDEQIMKRLVMNVEASIDVHPRKVYVIYQRPLHRRAWDSSRAFRCITSKERFLIYESACGEPRSTNSGLALSRVSDDGHCTR